MTTPLLFVETFRMGDCLYTAEVIDALQRETEAEIHIIVSDLSRGFDFIWERMGVQVHRFSFPWEKGGWQFRPLAIHKALQRVRSKMSVQFFGVHGFNPRGSFLQNQVLKSAGACTLTSLEFAPGTPFLWEFLGRDRRNIADSRRHFLTQCSRNLAPACPEMDTTFLRRYIQTGTVQNRILLSPGASTPIKFWEVEKWIGLAQQLMDFGFSVEAVTHPSSNVPDEVWPAGVLLFSGSIESLAKRIGESRMVISPDSFVAHLAAAVGVAPVVLFGSQVPELWSPPGARTVLAENISCRPCSQRPHRCRSGFRCMRDISVGKVLDVVIKEYT